MVGAYWDEDNFFRELSPTEEKLYDAFRCIERYHDFRLLDVFLASHKKDYVNAVEDRLIKLIFGKNTNYIQDIDSVLHLAKKYSLTKTCIKLIELNFLKYEDPFVQNAIKNKHYEYAPCLMQHTPNSDIEFIKYVYAATDLISFDRIRYLNYVVRNSKIDTQIKMDIVFPDLIRHARLDKEAEYLISKLIKDFPNLIRSSYFSTCYPYGAPEFILELLQDNPKLLHGTQKYWGTIIGIKNLAQIYNETADSLIYYILNAVPNLIEKYPKSLTYLLLKHKCYASLLEVINNNETIDVKSLKNIYIEIPKFILNYINELSNNNNLKGNNVWKMLNMKNLDGSTPLHLLAQKGYNKTCLNILKNNPSLGIIQDNFGNTFIHYSVLDEKTDLALTALSNHPELGKIQNNNGKTFIHLAAQELPEDKGRKICECAIEQDKELLTLLDKNGENFVDIFNRLNPENPIDSSHNHEDEKENQYQMQLLIDKNNSFKLEEKTLDR